MNYIQDIIILVLLLIGVFIGFLTGGIRKLWRVLVFSVFFFLSYTLLKELAINFLRYDLLRIFMPDGLNVKLEGLDITIYNIEDLFVILQNVDADLSGQYLKLTCELTCEVVFFIGCIIMSLIVSWPISLITYAIISLILPRFLKKKGIISRLFGGLFGFIEWIFVVILFGISVGQFSNIINNVNDVISGVSQLQQYKEIIDKVVKYANLVINPDNSIIMTYILKLFNSLGYDLYYALSFEFNGEKVTFAHAFDPLYEPAKELIAAISENSDGEVAVKTLALTNSVFNFGFN